MIAKQDLQHQPPGDWVHRWGFQTVSAMALGLALACGGGGGGGGSTTTPTEPTITSFTASPATLTVGDTSASLTAVFEHGTGAVDKGVGAVTSGAAKTIAPDTTAPATITYTLTVTGETGTTPVTKTANVKVVAAATKPAEITIGSGLTQFTTGVAGYTASVAEQTGCTYAWTITGGTATAGQTGSTVTFTAGAVGNLVLSCVVTNEAGKSAEAIERTVSVVAAVTITPVAINILAMPTGAPAADVVVTGPASYTHTLTASGTLTDLADGTYTVTANTVHHATLPALGLGTVGQPNYPSTLLSADAKLAYYPLRPVQTFTMTSGTPSAATITVRYPAPTVTIAIPDVSSPGNSVDMKFVLVPAGQFDMGSTDPVDSQWLNATSTTPHHITIAQAFYVAETPCTQAQYQAVLNENPSLFKTFDVGVDLAVQLTRPVEQVRWYAATQRDAVNYDYPSYIETLNTALPGYGFRLPSEAEYEYVMRAGTTTAYFFGDTSANLGLYAVWNKFLPDPLPATWAADHGTAPVKSKLPNQWGLYDIIGNVAEWCADRSHGLHTIGGLFYNPGYYPGLGSDGVGLGYDANVDAGTPANSYPAPPTDGTAWLSPYAPDTYNQRIQRGGGWSGTDSVSPRSAFRYDRPASESEPVTGFRLVMAVPAP